MDSIRILIVDDHTVVRDGLSAMLGREEDMTVVGEASNGLEAVEQEDRLKPDVIFVYDLELPADFEPRNTDGEIEEFHLWSLDEAMATTRDSRDFKFNCALVNIDFFLRHGALDPDGEPDYLEIAKGLLGCRESG